METQDNIRKAYTEYVLEHGTPPTSVFQFAKELNMAEPEFYDYYASFDGIEADIWLSFFTEARQTIEADETYEGYSVREKLLAFYFTWIELLKGQRSFVVYSFGRVRDSLVPATSLAGMAARRQSSVTNPRDVFRPFKEAFYDYSRDLLAEGRESKEVEPRPFIRNQYADGLWQQTLFLLNFWVRDNSKGFEKTDTAIEKAVNTAFDLLGRSPLDTLFDFVKFTFQNR